MKAVIAALGLISLIVPLIESLDNGLARSPPMGWLDWERFRCNVDCDNDPKNCISESLFMEMADRMLADGFKDAGYEYVNIDDCWASKERDENFKLQADPKRFPSGIPALAKYVHSKGLKLGIYGDIGTHTCGGYPGSKFFLDIDAQTFAEWEVDMLKLDGCYTNIPDMAVSYPQMGDFLNHTGRPILYSCSWPAYIVGTGMTPPYAEIAKDCNIWRNYDDISDSWDSVINIIEYYGNNSGNFAQEAGPGNFNDPDMLILGDFSLSLTQQKSQMAMWAMMASPLFMSTDLRSIPIPSRDLLQNRHAIRINQDAKGIQGSRILRMGSVEIWTKPILPEGSVAFALLSKFTGGTPTRVSLPLETIGLTNPQGYNITQVFENGSMGVFKPNATLNIDVDPTGVFLAIAEPIASQMSHRSHPLKFRGKH